MSTYTDRFAGPSREEVAARVNGGLPGAGTAGDQALAVTVTDVTVAPEPEPQARPLSNFATSLQARMRTWTSWLPGSRRRAGRSEHGTAIRLPAAPRSAKDCERR